MQFRRTQPAMAPDRLSAAPALQRSCSYRGFALVQQLDLSWEVRSKTQLNSASFTAPPSSLADVKALIDWHLDQTG